MSGSRWRRLKDVVRSRLRDGERGSAIIEFVFVAVLVMVPLVYFMAAIASVQRAQLAVTTAARESGRAFATASTADEGRRRADVAARLAFTDAGLRDTPSVRFVPVGAACTEGSITPTLAAGSEFTVCVVRGTDLPAIPTVLQGKGITSIGRYVVHVDDFRSAG